MRYYLASEKVAQSLNLTDCRRKTNEGKYILSQADIVTLETKDDVEEISEADALAICTIIKQAKI